MAKTRTSKKYKEALERGRTRKLTAPQAKLLRRIAKERWIAESEWQQRSLTATKGMIQRGLVKMEKRSKYYGSDAPNRYTITTEGRGALEAYEARETNPADNPLDLPTESEGRATYSVDGSDAYVHVWFDTGVAQTDFGHHVRDSGEWQVIVTTSPDPINQKPRGRELARETFRFADPRYRDQVYSSAQDYVRSALFQYRNNPVRLPNPAQSNAELANKLKF